MRIDSGKPIEAGRSAPQITTRDLDLASVALFGKALDIDAQAVRRALDPAANLATRTVTGGPAPAEMRRMLAARETKLAASQARIATIEARVAAAKAGLLEVARAFVA